MVGSREHNVLSEFILRGGREFSVHDLRDPLNHQCYRGSLVSEQLPKAFKGISWGSPRHTGCMTLDILRSISLSFVYFSDDNTFRSQVLAKLDSICNVLPYFHRSFISWFQRLN